MVPIFKGFKPKNMSNRQRPAYLWAAGVSPATGDADVAIKSIAKKSEKQKDIAALLDEPACRHNKTGKSGCAKPRPGASAAGCAFDAAQIALYPNSRARLRLRGHARAGPPALPDHRESGMGDGAAPGGLAWRCAGTTHTVSELRSHRRFRRFSIDFRVESGFPGG
jgi:hypothetical protein